MKTAVPTVSVVVPFSGWTEWVLDCVAALGRQTRQDFELWLLPDDPPAAAHRQRLDAMGWGSRLHVEPTGPGNPSRKRNVAIRRSGADVFALVDSDAWPREDWLEKAAPQLDGDVAVVTGPNFTPSQDPLTRRVAGRVMESPFGFGGGYLRHVPVSRRFVREMPTCNMILRRLGDLRFREDLDTGEDMVYCSGVRARGKRIVYDPDVVVFHHRRRLFGPFMKQFRAYGFQKGRLARSGSDVAYRWQFLPALLLLYLLGLGPLLWLPLPVTLRLVALLPAGLYAVIVVAESLRCGRSAAERFALPAAFVAGHAAYGAGYLVGLLTGRTAAGPSPGKE